MPILTVSRLANKVFRKLPLGLVLTLPFVVQTIGAVTLVGYLSYRSGQQSVANVSQQLMHEVGNRTTLYLEKTLAVPHLINQLNADAIRLGTIPGFETKNPATLEKYFLQQILRFPGVSTIAIANERGGMIGSGQSNPLPSIYHTQHFAKGTYSIFEVDTQGNVSRSRVISQNYDARIRPWYQTPKQAGKATWSPIYPFVSYRTKLGISAGLPVYAPSGKLQGVLATDITLDQFNQFLSDLHISKSGQVFIIERSGLVVASSTNQPLFRSQAGKTERLKALESKNSLIRETTAELTSKFGDFSKIHTVQELEIKQAGVQQFVRVMPFRDLLGLDWLIVIVVPESDFMAQIQANVYRTVMLCGLALLGAIGSGIWTSKRMTRSLFRLTQATQAVAAGTLDTTLPATRIAEVESLTASFRQMVRDLQQADQLRQNYAQDLERQVAEKTAALTEAQRIAKVGSWEFDLAKQEVIWSKQLYRIYEAEEQAPVPRPDLTLQRIHPDDQERYQREVAEVAIANQPFDTDLKIITQKGNIRYIHAKGQPICNAQGEVVKLAGTVADISDRKAAEIALKQSETRFLEISDSSPANIYILVRQVDGSFYFEHMSRAIETIHEISVEQILENANILLDRIHPEDRVGYEAAVKHSLENLQPFQHEWRVINPSGKIKWLQGSSRPKLRDNGEIAWHGVVIDISDRKLAEEALRQSEERFQEIASTINQLFFIRCAKSRQFLYVSPAYEKIFGRTCESLYQNPDSWLNAVHPDDRQQIIICLTQQFQGNNVTQEYRIIRPDHSISWIYTQILLVRDEAGNPLRFIGFSDDITERKQAEENLQRYERIVSATADGIALIDRNYIYQVVNQTYLIWYNKLSNEIVGHSVNDLLGSDLFENLVKERLDRCIAGETVRYQHWFEFKAKPTKQRFLNVTYSPYWEADNTISGVVVGLRDLTEQKRAELAFQKSEERYRQIVETADEGIWIIDLEGKTSFVNPKMTQMLGYSVEEMLGMSLFAFMDEQGKVLATRHLERRRQGIQERHEFKFRRKDGSELWALIASSPIFDDSGQYTGALGMITDISERQRAEEALKNSERKFKGAFDTIAVGMSLISIAGGFLEVNTALCQMLDYSESELLLMRWQDIISSEDQSQELEFIELMYAGEQVGYRLEQRFVRQDGTVIWGLGTSEYFSDARYSTRTPVSDCPSY